MRREYIDQIMKVRHLVFNQNSKSVLFQLYHTTFALSCQALNHTTNLFTLQELEEEFHKKIMFGFIEGIWYLDIIYQGQRPAPYKPEEDPDEGHDDRQELTVDQEENGKQQNEKVADDENYRQDFLSMLEDVIWLGGTLDVSALLKD